MPGSEQSAALRQELPPAVRERVERAPQLLDSLTEALDRGAAAWPQLSIPRRQWIAHLARRVPDSEDLARVVASLCAEDLYLCCACCAGEPSAIELFQQLAVAVIDSALRGLRLSAPLVDELRQGLLIELLVGSEDRPPKVASYGGIGRLRNWLKVVAVRAGGARLTQEKRVVPSDDQRLAEELVATPDLSALPSERNAYLVAFERALKDALSGLAPRDQNLLRQRFVDGLGLAALAAIYRVHHSTIHRRVQKIKEEVLARTHAALARELKIPARECSTIIRVIQSDLDLTLGSLLGAQRK